MFIFVIMIIDQNLTRKEQISQCATALFQQKGYAATSMRDLANTLGIEAASLYSHIKSKEEILQNICFKMAEEFFAVQQRAFQQSQDIEDRLRNAMIAHFEVIIRDTKASAVFFHEWRHMSEPYLSDFLKMREQYESIFLDIIKEGQASGNFIQIDNKFAVLTILSSINWTHNWYKPDGKMTADDVGQKLTDVLIGGLKIH